MQLIEHKMKFDTKKTEQTLQKEDKFISELFAITCIPERTDLDEEDDKGTNQPHGLFKNNKTKPTRAKSLSELQQRLEAITSRKKLSYKDKLTKKNLKTRLKKKNKRDERNAQQKLLRAEKAIKSEETPDDKKPEPETKPNKPIYNSNDKIVYSKFDFSNLGQKKEKKVEKDPKKLLKNLEKQNEILQKLEEVGEIGKAVEIKEKAMWKNALAKTGGQKVKDDPTLLKKTVKRQEQKQRSSKKKWEARLDGVKKAKDERQKKRTDNIEKRKKDKKNKKLKSASKRGKIIAGF